MLPDGVKKHASEQIDSTGRLHLKKTALDRDGHSMSAVIGIQFG